jgi:ribosomal protein L37E
MSTTPPTSTPSPGLDPTAQPSAVERCGQCGAPAAHEQRYCVNCGFHRRNAPDPVARYLSEASAARARVAAATALAAERGRAPRLGLRTVALLVALSLLVGVLIGGAFAGGSTPARQVSAAGGRSSRPSPSRTTAQGTTKLKKATGSSYLQQEQNLPNSVTP